jgi:starch-binding outer membrane protein, SusD/RagB family
MKIITITYSRLICWLLIIGLSSCSDYLDIVPKDQVTDGTVWASPANADMFLTGIYGTLPTFFTTTDPDENKTDNSMGKNGYASTTVYKKASYSAASPGSQTLWAQYNNIRRANLFIEQVTASSLPDSYKKLRLAEARFLRAYFYMLLWTHYGGVPIIKNVLNITEQGDAVFQPRNTDEETYKFITDECAAIANDLPNTQGKGRATKGAALTLKGWCELFNASPLKNPTNDKARWALAAATYKQVIDLGTYKLFPNYETMLYEENDHNPEVIFAREHIAKITSLGSSREGLWGPFKAGGPLLSSTGVNPSQSIVDAYRMSNGKDITDPSSGYDPQNPYANREKRFYSSIVHDGSKWNNGYVMVMVQGVKSENATDLGGATDATNTGYYLRKGMEEKNIGGGDTYLSGADFQMYRYAEVLLGYAEAQNEAVGPDASVYDAINKVRARAEIPPLDLGLSQAEMRIHIANERRIELFFEQKRWYDIIRLKTAEVVLNGTAKAMKIDLVNGKLSYSIVNASGGAMVFTAPKNYLWPIPQTAIDRNPKLTQNPNY